MKSVSNDFLKQNFFLVEFAHIQNLFCFQLLKNWKSFCWLTNKRFISSAKSKHKKTECWFLVNHETLVVYKWVKTPFVFDCQLCCSLISRFLILVRLSCLLSCLSSCLFFCLLSCLVSIILNYVTFRPVLICPMHWTAYFASTQFWSTLINSVISSIPFRPVFICLISLWTAGILVCFCFTPNIFCPMLHSSALLSSAQTSSTPVPFPPVLTCPISCWTAGIFICFCFIPILSNARLDRSKWTKRDIQLRSAQTSSAQQNSAQFSSKMSIF